MTLIKLLDQPATISQAAVEYQAAVEHQAAAEHRAAVVLLVVVEEHLAVAVRGDLASYKWHDNIATGLLSCSASCHLCLT